MTQTQQLSWQTGRSGQKYKQLEPETKTVRDSERRHTHTHTICINTFQAHKPSRSGLREQNATSKGEEVERTSEIKVNFP